MADLNDQLSEMEKGQAQLGAKIPEAIAGLASPTWESNDGTLNSPLSMYFRENCALEELMFY
jgi:hypothetical protein